MAIAWRKIVITQDVPDNFYSYMMVDFAYYVSLSVGDYESTAVITCLNTSGAKEEVYRNTFVNDVTIKDIGAIVENHVKRGIHEFTITITADIISKTRSFKVEYITPKLVIKDKFPKLAFSSALDSFSFEMVGTRQNYSAKVEIIQGVDIILSETYVPDVNNEITIRDLSSLINPYLQEILFADFQVKTQILKSESNEQMDYSKILFTALYCKADVDMLAEDFISRFFLSTLMGDKVTAPGRKEYVHFVTTEEDFVVENERYLVAMQINVDWVDSDFKKTSDILMWYIELSTADTQRVTMDISPDKFERKDLVLVGYTVIVGNRRQRYVVDNECPDTNPAIAFINSFGCQETLYFTGTNEIEPSIKRNAAYMNGIYRNYHVEEERNFKADTGVIPESMLCLIDDLARSTDTYLIEKGEIGREITITDSETKRDNNLDTLFRASITYRVASRNQNILSPLRPAKTFDKTFDKTYR